MHGFFFRMYVCMFQYVFVAESEQQLQALRQKHEELTAQQAVTLELLGEREEELEALRCELEDVKEIFRVQLEALMSQAIVNERTTKS